MNSLKLQPFFFLPEDIGLKGLGRASTLAPMTHVEIPVVASFLDRVL
jgi:hypothetical protein